MSIFANAFPRFRKFRLTGCPAPATLLRADL
jgi:hypothetical protein